MVAVPRHLSGEAGHSSGLAAVLVTAGLVITGLGLVLFLFAVGRGLLDGLDGASNTDALIPWMPLGGVSLVFGLVVAAAGMTLSRHDAGE